MDFMRTKLDDFLRENGVLVDNSTLDKLDSDNLTYVYTVTLNAPEKE